MFNVRREKSLFPGDEERFLSDWVSKENYLMDTLFCEFAHRFWTE